MSATVATIVLDAALEARTANLQQDRLISIVARLVDRLGRTQLTDQQRELVTLTTHALNRFEALNDHEGEQHQIIAGLADQLAPALETWSVRQIIRSTRDPLADLLNPIIQGAARESALCRVLYVIRAAPPEIVGSHEQPNLSLRHELGVNKVSLLWDLVREHGPVA